MPDEPVGIDDLAEVEPEVLAKGNPKEFGMPLRNTLEDQPEDLPRPKAGWGEGVVTLVGLLIGVCGFRSLFSHSVWQLFILMFMAALVIGAFVIISGYRATRKEPILNTQE